VPSNECDVFINNDGSIDVEYRINFLNKGKPIDIVDVGLPHPEYRLETAKAELRTSDGRAFQLTKIFPSTYIEVGVEVLLRDCEIQKGEQAEFYFRINVPDMVFKDDADPDYASVNFVPTWFAPELVTGKTHLVVKFHFPQGVSKDEPRYHGVENAPQKMGFENNRFTYTWVIEEAEQKPYKFGASFPKKFVGKTTESWRYNPKWLTGEKRSGGSSSKPSLGSGPIIFTFVVLLYAALSILTTYINRNKYKRQYIPPSIGIESAGARKGLKPCEAAVVLQLPPEQIIGIAILELVEEGVIRVDSISPLDIKPLRRTERLEPYQQSLVEALTANVSDKVRQLKIEGAFVALVKKVKSAMTGYSFKDTKEYYRDMVKYASEKLGSGDLKYITWGLLENEKDLEDSIRDKVVSQRRARYPFLVYDNYWWSPFHRRFLFREDSYKNVLMSTNPRAYQALTSTGRGGRGGFGGCACACAGCACACAGGGR